MRIQPRDKTKLLQAALGEIPCDLAVTNVKMVNVFTGEVYPATMFVYDGFICHVEKDHPEQGLDLAAKVVDGQGQYLIPGLIDAHMHIESSMLTPRNLASVIIPHGTTTIITDPHEIANVYGVEGVEYMLEASEDLPMRQYINIPSCVPSVPGLENAGAEFHAAEIEKLAAHDRVIGLAEVMDFVGVIHGEPRMMEIIAAAERCGLNLQGHAPSVSGRALSAYLCAGPSADHESCKPEEAEEKLRAGMFVDARESSIVRNVRDLWPGVSSNRFFDSWCLCTDDREADDLLNIGHMNNTVRVAIDAGMDPVLAVKSATWNSAREIHADNLGAIAPGFTADFLLVPDLREMNPSAVYYGGCLVAENGAMKEPVPARDFPLEHRNSMKVQPLRKADFELQAPVRTGTVKVHVMAYADRAGSLTSLETAELPVQDGCVQLNDPELKFVAVVNRYGKGTIGLGVVRGFGLACGACGSTVSHDSHNLTIVYEKPEDALLLAEELIRVGGGMCAVKDGRILHTLALPLAGLMSLKSAQELSPDARQMKQADEEVGLTGLENPLLRIVTLALPVIPAVKMSDLGLVDVMNKKLIPLFA
jgi:adenine deaminase